MTKAHIAADPSMEDILASIRKMISEDRLGPRPVPDQIARTTLGEEPAAKSTAKSVDWDAATQPAAKPDEPAPAKEAAERASPSFSSLSDALKTAAPGPERGTLDDKIADMLQQEKAPAPAGDTAAPAPLAVFAANTRSPQTAPEQAGPRTANADAAPRRPDGRGYGARQRGSRSPTRQGAVFALARCSAARPPGANERRSAPPRRKVLRGRSRHPAPQRGGGQPARRCPAAVARRFARGSQERALLERRAADATDHHDARAVSDCIGCRRHRQHERRLAAERQGRVWFAASVQRNAGLRAGLSRRPRGSPCEG